MAKKKDPRISNATYETGVDIDSIDWSGLNTGSPAEEKPARTERTWGEAASDVGVGILKGAVSGAHDIANFASAITPGFEDDKTSGPIDTPLNWAEEKLESAKSDIIRAKAARFSDMMQDPNVTAGEVTAYLWNNKDLVAQLGAESTGAMAVGFIPGAAVGKIAAVKALVQESGVAARAVGSIGEAMQIGGNVAEATDSTGGALGGAALGVLTNIVTPGNISGAVMKKLAGRPAAETAESAIEEAARSGLPTVLSQRGAAGAAARTGVAMGSEAAQEYGQEFGEKAITDFTKTGEIDLTGAHKAGVVGGILGGAMGGGLHPIVGHGGVGTREEIQAAQETQRQVEQTREALAADPGNPARQTAHDNALAVQQASVPADVRNAAIDATVAATTAQTLAAPDVSSAIEGFNQQQQASQGRTGGQVASEANAAANAAASEAILQEHENFTGAPELDVLTQGERRLEHGEEIAVAPLPENVASDIRRVANFIPGRDSMVEIAPIVARMAGDPSAGTPIARPANIPQQVWSNFVRDAQMETGIMVPFENSQGQTLRANLQRIAESGSRTGRLLAETLLAQNSPHLDMQVEEFTPEDYQSNRASARGYVRTTGEGTPVRFAMNQSTALHNRATESTFIHETLHALTMQWLRTVSTNDPLYVELKSLRDQVKAAAEAQGKTFYGTHPGVPSERSALAEFLAESFSRSTFQTFLDTVQVSSNRTGWQAFSQWVARLLGVHDRQGVRALDLALRINEDVMARSAEIARGENAAPAPAPEPTADPYQQARQAIVDLGWEEDAITDFEGRSDEDLESIIGTSRRPIAAEFARQIIARRADQSGAASAPEPTAAPVTTATQLTSAQRGAITRTRNDIIRMMRELADQSRANGSDPHERLNRAISAAQRARVSRRQNSDLARRLHSLFNNQNLNWSHEVRWANDRMNEVLGTPMQINIQPHPASPAANVGTGAGRPFVQPQLDADTSRTGIPTTPFASQPAPTTAPAAPAAPTQASLEAEVDAAEADLRQISYGTWQPRGVTLDRPFLESISEAELEQARDYTTNQTSMPRTAALIRAIQNRNAFESGLPLPHPRFVAVPRHTLGPQTPAWPGTAPVANRENAAQTAVPSTELVPPSIEQDYNRRLENARQSGALKRLADFWRTVIGAPGQRIFEPTDIPLDDLKARVRANGNSLTQADLDELKNRYNNAFHRKAVEWAEAHGQPAPAREDIIISLNGSGSSASISLYGVNRGNPTNPFLRAKNRAGDTPSAYASLGPHNTTTGLSDAPGSSDIAYRVAADMAYLRGASSRSSTTLLTNNNVRRQVQSMLQGLRLNEPEALSPMVGSGANPREGQQGQPQAYNQLSDEEKIGANVLRTLHNTFINREGGAYLSKARALGNLVLNPDGQTYTAVGDPIDTRGFADGTVITKQQLEDKISELKSFDRSSSGGIGADIATLSMISQQVLNDFEQNPNANIPEVLVNMARTFGSEAGGWLMSRDAGVTPEVEALLEEHRRPDTTPQRRGEINAEIRALQEQERVEPSTPEEMDQEAVARMSEQYGAAQAASEAFRAAGSGRQVLFSMDAAPSDPDVAATPQAQAAIVSQMVSPPSQNEIEIAPRARLGWKERMVEKIATLLVDKHSTLGRILRILGDISTTKAIDRFEGRRQSQFEELVRTPLANIENLLNRNNITRQQFEEYLVMRHVREYNTAMARINPLQERNGETTGYDHETRPASGTYNGESLTTSRADAYMAQEHNEHVVEAARLYDDMMHALQDYAVETGLESRQTVEYWRNNLFPNYVPFRRVLDLEATGGTGAGFSVREGVTHRAMGSSAEIAQVIPSVMELATRIVDRGEKARIAQTLLRTARTRAIPMYRSRGGELRPMWRVDTMPNIRTIVRTHIYNVLDGTNNPVRNSAGVPIEFYNAGDARAFATAQSRANGTAFHTHDAGFQDRVQVRHNPAYINKDNVLIVPENGENHVLVFDEQSSDAMEMIKGLKNLDSPKLEGLIKAANVFSRWTVGTSTGYNPFFAPINFLRDIQASAVNMNSANVPGWTKGDSVALMGESARNVAPLMRYLQRQHAQLHGNNPRQPAPLPGTPEGWMEFAKRSGGLTGVRESFSTFEDNVRQAQHLFGEDLTPYAQEPDFRVRRDWAHRTGERAEAASDTFGRWLEGDSRMRVARILSNVPVTISNLNNAFELATRTAAFKMAYEKFVANGMSQQRAAEEAAVVSKNVSVNFNRRGNMTAQMNALFPFFNAAMQGSARLAELLFKKEQFRNEHGAMEERSTLTSAGKKLLYALPALGGMQALLLAAAGFDDGQPPDYEKDRNFIIPLGGKTYGKIPLPLGLNALFNMGRNGMEAVLNPKNALKHAQNFFTEPFNAFNPLGGTPNVMLQLTPAALDVPVALMMNKDFANRPIFKEDRDPRRPTPGFTRHKEGTSQLSIGIAEMLNNLTGGNEYRPGLINYTGDQIEYVFGQIGGGMTREAMKTGQFVAETATGSRASEDRPWYKVPLASRFVGSAGDSSAVRSDLYSASAELNVLNAEYEGLKDAGKRAEAAAFLKEHPEIRLRSKVEKYFNAEGKARKERQAYQSEGEGEKVAEINTRMRTKGEKLLEEIDAIKSRAAM